MQFPKLPKNFEGPKWNLVLAYETVKKHFDLLGFKKGGSQHSGNPLHMPSCFPETISWESFKHPSVSD